MAGYQTSCSLQLRNCLRGFSADIGLDSDELAILRSTSLSELQETLRQIQEDQKRTRSMLYMRRLSPFLDAVDQYREVLQGFLDPSEYVACIWVCEITFLHFNLILSFSRDV